MPPHSKAPSTRGCNFMIFDAAVVGILCFAALAWGANEPWAMAFISILTFATLALRSLWDCLRGGATLKVAWGFVPLFMFAAYAGLQLLRPAPALRPGSVSPPLTVEPYSTGLYLLLAGACVALAFLVANGFRTRLQVKRLLICLLALGVFEALYGLAQYLGGYHYIWDFPVAGDYARGTLVNRNHYALLLNLSICCGIGYLYYRSAHLLPGRDLTFRAVLGRPGSAKLAWVILWLGIIGLALVFSMSRMGIFAMLFCIGVMIVSAKASAKGGRRTTVMGFALLCLILGLAVYVGVDAVLARFEAAAQTGILERDRFPIWSNAWTMARSVAAFGQGLGTFQWTFPAYERIEPDIPARYAHNDYLQLLAETGGVGLLMVAAAFVAAWLAARKNLVRSSDPLVRGVGLATLGALSAAALQEITDFSLYIPGVAVFLAVIIGLNYRAAGLDFSKSGQGDSNHAHVLKNKAGESLA